MQELILAHVMVTVSEEFSPKEKALIKELRASGSAIDVVIPDTIEAADFDVALSAICRVIALAEKKKEQLFPVLGRLLFVASEHLESVGYDTFEALVVSIGDRFGVGRTTCFDAKAYWRRWNSALPPEEYSAVGRVKLKMISDAVDSGAEKQKKTAAAVEFAKEHTAEQLEEYLEQEFKQPKGSTTGAVLRITSSKAANKRIVKWFSDGRVAAYCGTDDMAAILEHMIEECYGEWFISGQQKLDDEAANAEVQSGGEVPAEA